MDWGTVSALCEKLGITGCLSGKAKLISEFANLFNGLAGVLEIV